MSDINKLDMKPEVSLVEDIENASAESSATNANTGIGEVHFSEGIHDLDSIEETEPGWFIYFITFAVALGGCLFGYDTGVISGVLTVIGTDLDGKILTTNEKELITSIVSLGAFIGGILGGALVDRIGRRIPMVIASVLFTLGAIIQAASFSIAQMTVGRLVVGFGVGLAAMIVPVYIAELSPAKYRGRLISLDSVCITGSQVLSYIIDFAFQYVDGGWRYMVGGAAIPSIILGFAVYWAPDTPRFMIQKGRTEEAAIVIRKIFPNATDKQVEDKINLIDSTFHFERTNGELSLKQKFKILYGDNTNLKALIVGCGVMAIQQLAGSNTMTYYAPTLFALVGFDQSIAVGIVISATNAIFTGVSMLIIERVGRRRLLLSTVWMMSAFLIVGAVAIHYIPISRDLTVSDDYGLTWAGILVLVSIICYIASYAVGLGNIGWFGNELLPMEVRSLGATMINSTCWALNALISSTYLSMMKKITPSGAFGFYVGTTFVGWICIIFFYPEVTGMSLEEIKEVFDHGFGVRYSEKVRKERKLAHEKHTIEENIHLDDIHV